MNTFGSDLHPQYLADNTLVLPDVLAGFANRNAIGSSENVRGGKKDNCKQSQERCALHLQSLWPEDRKGSDARRII